MFNRLRMRKEKPSKSETISTATTTVIQNAAKDNNKLILDNSRWEASFSTLNPGRPRRLQKELMSLIKEPPPGVSVDEDSVSQNLTQWIINIDGVEGTLYEGEHFQLLFKFNNKYPFDSPEVTFIGSNIPVHPHVYSNGHICLSILTDDW
ncbi:AGAP005324-PA-like protein [Anopheles sinensis]|uniref:AGAP005324-PA-like protein n=1 Tax=Anopheles sinensis TaxID=74873 RepID=A0A084W2H0_ANOSI|nr:AGAP005324-PA-like protein [Anopheles sinensis]